MGTGFIAGALVWGLLSSSLNLEAVDVEPVKQWPLFGANMKSKLYPIGVALALLTTIMMAGILMVPK